MRRLFTTLLAFTAAFALAQDATTHPAAGTWEGAIEIPGSPLGVIVTLAHDGDAWTGAIDIPAQGAAGMPLAPVTVDADSVSFVIAGVPGDPTFDGAVDGDALTGTFTQGGQSFPFTLSRVATGAPAADDTAASEYVDPQGRFTVPIPTGWTATEHDGFVRIAAPEEGLHLDIVVTPGDAAEEAIAAGWLLTAPDQALEPFQTLEPPSEPGVDRTVILNYDVGDPNRIYQAFAQVVGGDTYAMHVFAELGMLQRRNAQLQIVASGFEITALETVDLSAATPLPVVDVTGALDEFVAYAMDAFDIPGAAIAIVQDGEVVYLEGFGVTIEGGSPITPDTHMMIGSTGKTMTALLVASLVDDGVIDWDTPVVEVLPRFAVADEELSTSITFRNLLCACTGVPRRDLELAFNYHELSAEGVIESLRTFEFFTEFGEAFQYSNQLVATAGYAAAAAAGASYGELAAGYRDLLNDRLTGPVGMTDTTLDFQTVIDRGQYATPHGLSLDTLGYEPVDLAFEELLIPVGPAGTHWSTAGDMAEYLQTVLARGVAPNGTRVVSEENLGVTWEPQVPITATDSYGLGWMVGSYKGAPLYSHGGNTIGFTSEFAFLPEVDLGIVILTNAQAANSFTGTVTSRFLELVYQQPDETVAQTEYVVEQTRTALQEQRSQVLDRVPLVDALTYFGPYTNPALGDVSLRIEDGQLLLDAGEWATQLRPYVDRNGEFESYVTYGAPLTGLTVRLSLEDGAPRMVLGDGIVSYEFESLR